MPNLRIACVQLTSGPDWQANLDHVLRLMTDCLVEQPRLIALPENVFLFNAKELRNVGQGDATAQILDQIKAFAKQHAVYILIGSHPMVRDLDGASIEPPRVRQASLLINDAGDVAARYDKIHLFDVTVDDKASVYQESRFIEPGEVRLVVADVDGVKVGLSICYDLRFPEFYRLLAEEGAHICFVPSAFTHKTGEAHWHCLLQARAIENQMYIAGVDQVGWHTETRQTFGNSVAYSPWGVKLTALDDQTTGHIVFDVNTEELDKVRAAMPCLQHRRIK